MSGLGWLALLLVAWLNPVAAMAQEFPALAGRVVDAASIIPPDVEAQLNAKLAGLESQSQRQLVIATLPSLQGYEISDYGYQLGRHWGIGDKERNDGALLIVAPNERKVRIEVGYGLEPILTDGLAHLIIQNDILPRFKAGDMPGGIVAGTDSLITQLTLPEDQARQVAADASAAPESSIPLPMIIWLLFFFFFFVLPVIRRVQGGRAYGGGAGPVIVWGGGSSRSSGGFSGGGGSFGGGGSSGSW